MIIWFCLSIRNSGGSVCLLQLN